MTTTPSINHQGAGSPNKASGEVACPGCGRGFKSWNDAYQHARSKHTRKLANNIRPARELEPSLGEELTDAILAHQCGEPVPEHLRAMFPEAFK